MFINIEYALISVIIVSLISLIVIIPLLIKKEISKEFLIILLSLSVGVLLSTVIFIFLPEIIENSYLKTETEEAFANMINRAGIFILFGFLAMFILEKIVHFNHEKKFEKEGYGHGHAYHIAPMNLIGDGIHNFIDGLVIAGSYAINITLGISATISIIFHEIPQEISDFGVLLYSGMSKKKALLFNFLSATAAIIGTLTGYILIGKIEGFTDFIIPFSAGSFIYIAAANLIPQLHRQCKLKETILHISAILIGIGIIYFVPHVHGH